MLGRFKAKNGTGNFSSPSRNGRRDCTWGEFCVRNDWKERHTLAGRHGTVKQRSDSLAWVSDRGPSTEDCYEDGICRKRRSEAANQLLRVSEESCSQSNKTFLARAWFRSLEQNVSNAVSHFLELLEWCSARSIRTATRQVACIGGWTRCHDAWKKWVVQAESALKTILRRTKHQFMSTFDGVFDLFRGAKSFLSACCLSPIEVTP